VAFLQVAKAAADADAEFLGGLLSGFVHYYAKELRWWEDAVTIHRVGVQVQVRGRVCLFEMPFFVQTIVLPRQARDKRRGNSERE
jgi:hypothetical protein